MSSPAPQPTRPRSSRREEALTPTSASNDWPMVRLGDHVVKVGSGFTPLGGHAVYQQTGVPLIRSQNVHMNRFEPDGLAFISPEQNGEMTASRVEANDVLLNITGASIGRVCVVPSEFCPANVNQHVCIIRSDGTLASEFLAFYFASAEFQKFIMQAQAGGTRQALTKAMIENFRVPLAPLAEQRRIAGRLRAQMAEVARARAAVTAQLAAAAALPAALLRESLHAGARHSWRIPEILAEVTQSIGEQWSQFPVLGATRAGLAPAKESVGKNPGRYKPVTPGTVFYNPMRILLGSIALVDNDDAPGITSPDYVVLRGIEGRLHSTWFYYWFRSPAGAEFIQSLTRGAVRERLLFNRLAAGEVTIPTWDAQLQVVEQLRALKSLVASLQARLAEIERLPAALLRAAFSGAPRLSNQLTDG